MDSRGVAAQHRPSERARRISTGGLERADQDGRGTRDAGLEQIALGSALGETLWCSYKIIVADSCCGAMLRARWRSAVSNLY